MTISSTSNRNGYTGNDTTATYGYTFRIPLEADIKVTVRNTTTDVESTLTLTTDYTLTGVGDAAGGTIVLVDAAQAWISGTSNLDTGYKLTIRRVVGLTQGTDIRNQGDFFPEIHEDVFDKNIMIAQQQQDEIDRSVRLPETVASSEFDTTIPADIVGTNSLALISNPAGTGFAVGPSTADISGANASAVAAAASAAAALVSENAAAVDLGLTNADVVSTNADVVLTNADVVLTAADAAQTALDVIDTNADVSTTNADVILTNADVVITNADVVLTSADVTNAGISETNAAASAAAAAVSAAASQWQDVALKVFADSPIAPVDGDSGTMFSIDCTNGNVVVNLPAISVLTLSSVWAVGFKKTDSSANTVVINRNGTDTIDGATSYTLALQDEGVNLIPDVDGTPDDWTSLGFNNVIMEQVTDETSISGKSIGLADNPIIPGTNAMIPPVGTTAQGTSTTDGAFRFNSTLNRWEGYKSGAFGEIGGAGGGGLDDYHTENFETTVAADFTSGLNATFLTAGTFGGVLSDETSSPLAGDSSLKYVAGATSTNDWFASPAITLDTLAKNNDGGITFYHTWDGTADIQLVIWDITNAENLLSTLDVVTTQTSATRFSTTFFPPSTATTIKYGFHFINAPTNGDILIFDNLVLSTNPFTYKNLIETQVYRIRQAGASLSDVTGEVEFNLGTATINDDGDVLLIAEDDSGNTRTKFIAQVDCAVSVSANLRISSSSIFPHIYLNGSAYISGAAAAGTNYETFVGGHVNMVAGDYLSLATTVGTASTSGTVNLTFKAQRTTEHIVTPAKSGSQNLSFFGLGSTMTSISAGVLRFGTIVEDGIAHLTYDDSNGRFTANRACNVKTSFTGRSASAQSLDLYKNGATIHKAYQNSANVWADMSHGIPLEKDDYIQINVGAALTSGHDHSLNVVAYPKEATFPAAVPVQKVAYISDQKGANVPGGLSTVSTWLTRDLNDTKGNADFVSISSNQIILQPGLYKIKGNAPCFNSGVHKLKLYNITDASDEIIGSSESSSSTSQTRSFIEGELNITIATTYELRHRVSTSKSTDGFGLASNMGVGEVYAQVEIVKLR